MKDTLQDKVVLVTGAASGIGRAAAVAFARAGARVLLSDVQEQAGEAAAAAIREGGGIAYFLRGDVSRDADAAALVAEAESRFGGLDIAVNNAGIENASAPAAALDETVWDKTMAVNLKGVWLGLRHQIPALLRRGGGSIVNVSSIAGQVGFAGSAAYVASKHGVIGLTRAAALDYAKQGIRVNALCPGVIQTPMVDRSLGGNPEAAGAFAQGIPLGRFGTPEEIAEGIVWLASPAASYVTGHALTADGGWTVA